MKVKYLTKCILSKQNQFFLGLKEERRATVSEERLVRVFLLFTYKHTPNSHTMF